MCLWYDNDDNGGMTPCLWYDNDDDGMMMMVLCGMTMMMMVLYHAICMHVPVV